MPSQHGSRFSDERSADRYDAALEKHAQHPALVGYSAAVAWGAERIAAARPRSGIVDLGSGTGNLALRYVELAAGDAAHITCVDLSPKMLSLSKDKLGGAVTTVESDLLDFVRDPSNWTSISVASSSYALHHLVGDEKQELLDCLYRNLPEGGAVVVIDPMIPNEAAIPDIASRVGRDILMPFIRDEYPWYIDQPVPWLSGTGFVDVDLRQFSSLTWGFAARKDSSQLASSYKKRAA